ncbi:thiopeptide-type bacteriocin biosynthesis protein [Streptosporangium saharense]|uniref:thiopeptide-type bacteriocin biosynthesis protein n=1 Tax=Streptosporangium saharense TaxID=1706840 RepID=UPI0036BB1D92
MRPAGDWHQANLTFTDPGDAEHLVATRIAPALRDAETGGAITCWWFTRKRQWRIRYRATSDAAADTVWAAVTASGPWSVTASVYEPETHAFGGSAGMHAAHALFHADSHHILNSTHDRSDRRELTILLCTAMMRAARLDWFEQGDIWACIAALRPPADLPTPTRWACFKTATRRLLTADTRPLRASGSLTYAADRFTAFEQTGITLEELNRDGALTRGLRAVIAHHIVFAWNRLGLPTPTQAAIAQAAKEVILDEPPQQQARSTALCRLCPTEGTSPRAVRDGQPDRTLS